MEDDMMNTKNYLYDEIGDEIIYGKKGKKKIVLLNNKGDEMDIRDSTMLDESGVLL